MGRYAPQRMTHSELALESLEDRVMLASVSLLDFNVSSGYSGTANGQFVAHLTGTDFHNVEIDVDGVLDSSGKRHGEYFAGNNGTLVVTAQGNMPFGTHTIFARALDYMSMMNGGTSGGWQPFQITVAQPTPVSVSFASSSQNINTEGELRTVAVQLSSAATSPVSVGISMVGGTATYGADLSLNTQSVYFAPGETSKTINLQFIDDQIVEPTETYTLRLQGPSGAVLGANPDFQGEILDGEIPVTASWIEVSNARGTEGANLEFRVELIGNVSPGTQIPIGHTFVPGTAIAGENGDYRDNHVPLTLSVSNRVGYVSAYAMTDANNEDPEQFYLYITNTAGREVKYSGNLDKATGTILNQQAPLLIVAPAFVDEGALALQNVGLTFPIDVAAEFLFQTGDGTATASDLDYAPFSGTVAFAAGEVNASISVNALPDDISPENEYYRTYFASPNCNMTAVVAAVNINDKVGEPELKLDVTNDSFTTSQVDQVENYLPGYEGTAVMLWESHAQQVQVIGSGLEPDSKVTFRLRDTTKHKGMASNAKFDIAMPLDSYDFAFDTEAESQEKEVVVGGDGRAIVKMYVFDFGGVTTVEMVQSGEKLDEMQVPIDENHDDVADVWAKKNLKEGDGSTDKDKLGTLGDVIPAFDEYRGFIVQGKHIRTNPEVKTLFIWNQLGEAGGDNPFDILDTSQVEWFVVGDDEFYTYGPRNNPDDRAINYFGKGIKGVSAEEDKIRTIASVVPVFDTDDIRPLANNHPTKPYGLTLPLPKDSLTPLSVHVDSRIINQEYEVLQSLAQDGSKFAVYKVSDPENEGVWVANGQIPVGGYSYSVSYEKGFRSNGISINAQQTISESSKTILVDDVSNYSTTPGSVTIEKNDTFYLVEGTNEIIRFVYDESKAIKPVSFKVSEPSHVIGVEADTIELKTNGEINHYFGELDAVYYAYFQIDEKIEWISFTECEGAFSVEKISGVKRGLFGTESFENVAGVKLVIPAQLFNIDRGIFGSTAADVPKGAHLQVVGVLEGVTESIAVGAKFHPFDELFLKATIAHEIGHALGLEHEGSKGTIMAEGVWQGTYPGPENPDPSKPDPRELYVEFIEYNRDKLNFKTKLTINLRDFTGD